MIVLGIVLLLTLLATTVYALRTAIVRADRAPVRTQSNLAKHSEEYDDNSIISTQDWDTGYVPVVRQKKKHVSQAPVINISFVIAAAVVFFAIVSLVLMIHSHPSAIKKSNNEHNGTTQTTFVTTTEQQVSATSMATNSGSPVFQAPQGNYTVEILPSQTTWVEVDEINSGKVVEKAGTFSAGQTVSVTVTGPINIILGKTGSVVKVNGVSLNLPSSSFAGTIELR